MNDPGRTYLCLLKADLPIPGCVRTVVIVGPSRAMKCFDTTASIITVLIEVLIFCTDLTHLK